MDIDLEKARELSYISKLSGQDERIVQAGGGNTSVKLDDRYMLVKESGCHLTSVTEKNGYAIVDHRHIVDIFSRGEVDDSQEADILSAALIEGKRPSIETFLHSVTCRYTIHTHPLGVTMYAAREGGMEELQKLFPEAVMVGYATPGIKLAKKYYAAVQDKPDKSLIFLENHGMVVSADTLSEAIRLQMEVIRRVDSSLGLDTAAVEAGQELFSALQKLSPGLIAYRVDTPAAKAAVKAAGGVWEHAYSPDCVVYCGNRIAVIDGEPVSGLLSHREQYGMPKAVLYKGYLFAVAENMNSARDIACMLDFTAQVYLSSKGHTMLPLSGEEKNFLLNWDAEKYRMKL